MTFEERQALREKHQRNFLIEDPDGDMCLNCLTPWRCNGPHGEDICASCFDERGFGEPYPCDVIKVLDAWDFEQAMIELNEVNREMGLPE